MYNAAGRIRVLLAAGVYVGCKLADGNVGCRRGLLLWNAVDPAQVLRTGIEGAALPARTDRRAPKMQSGVRWLAASKRRSARPRRLVVLVIGPLQKTEWRRRCHSGREVAAPGPAAEHCCTRVRPRRSVLMDRHLPRRWSRRRIRGTRLAKRGAERMFSGGACALDDGRAVGGAHRTRRAREGARLRDLRGASPRGGGGGGRGRARFGRSRAAFRQNTRKDRRSCQLHAARKGSESAERAHLVLVAAGRTERAPAGVAKPSNGTRRRAKERCELPAACIRVQSAHILQHRR
jgi:hypothetical protein